MAVAVHQHHGFKPPVRSQRCRLPSFTHLDFFLCEPNQIDTTHSLGQVVLSGTSFPRSVSTPCLTLTSKVEEEVNDNPRVQLIGGHGAPRVRALVVEVAIAIASGVDSVPIASGLGGAYFLRNRNGDTIAVTKPIDEEPLALNNPKGFTGRMLGQPGLKRSVRVGETGIRELAAYLLDHGGFAGIPPTALVKFSHVAFLVNKSAPVATPPYKIASLQHYVDHESDAGDLGPSGFSVSSVHRIGILDVRLLNIDRHSGNILVKKHEHDKYSLGVAELVPIDHGLCLPEWLDDPYFEWLHWPQASIPFSEAEMEYISNLDPFEDAKLLRTQIPCLSESSVRVLVVCTLFLKLAVSAGLCLSDIGEMMTRDRHGGAETMSVLENVCSRAKDTTFMVHNDIDCEDRAKESDGEEEDDDQMFHFDEEREDNTDDYKGMSDQLKAFMGKPPLPLPPKLKTARPAKGLVDVNEFNPMVEADKCPNFDNGMTKKCVEAVDLKGKDGWKTGNLFKSISLAAPCPKREEKEGVSLGEMNKQEWEFFLEMFQRLLPEVFEEKKSICLIQRLGSA